MFSLFKKEKINNNEVEEELGQEVEEKKIESMPEREIVIHAMPKHFRLDSDKVNQAKNAGMVVMVVGVIFIMIIIFLVYFFVFKDNNKKPQVSENNKSTTQENQPPFEINQEKVEEEDIPVVTLENYYDDIVSTSTLELEDENIDATTTLPATEISLYIDADSDRLSAKEEFLLGTSDENIDTDGDGYSDYSELINLYDPAGPGKLIDNINIGKYENKTFSYSLFYPLGWIKSAISGEDSVMFRSEDNSFIQIIVQPNPNKQSIEDWYGEQFGNVFVNPERKILKDDWSGIKNEDGLIVYLADKAGNYIFVLSYVDSENTVFYKNIFDMIVNSLVIGE